MREYIDKEDALDILDQFEDAVENGDGRSFYSKARDMMRNLYSEEIIHCKDCEYYCNVLYQGTQFEYGECSRSPFSRIFSDSTGPYDFCSRGEIKKNEEWRSII